MSFFLRAGKNSSPRYHLDRDQVGANVQHSQVKNQQASSQAQSRSRSFAVSQTWGGRYLSYGLEPNPRLNINLDSESESESESEDQEDEEEDEEEEEEEEEEGEEEGSENGTDHCNETKEDLSKLTVKELKQRLRRGEMPVSGRKAVLIDRLLGKGETAGGKITEWKKSKAKAFLLKLFEDENSKVHKMTAREIYDSHDWFQSYTFAKFKTYLETIQKAAQYLRNVVCDDEREIWSELIAFPRAYMTIRGYPFWHIHDARSLLEKDVREGKADEMKPKELWEARLEYQDFPELVFCHHVHQERRRQREEPGWVVKRNKKAQKMYEEEVMANKESWNVSQFKQEIIELCDMWETA